MTFHILNTCISDKACEFCSSKKDILTTVEKELLLLKENYQRSYTAINERDAQPYTYNLWICHLLNDINRIDLYKHREKGLNKEIREHLITVQNGTTERS